MNKWDDQTSKILNTLSTKDFFPQISIKENNNNEKWDQTSKVQNSLSTQKKFLELKKKLLK